jgi:hypothetical protein
VWRQDAARWRGAPHQRPRIARGENGACVATVGGRRLWSINDEAGKNLFGAWSALLGEKQRKGWKRALAVFSHLYSLLPPRDRLPCRQPLSRRARPRPNRELVALWLHMKRRILQHRS